jgi:hypothetical protein
MVRLLDQLNVCSDHVSSGNYGGYACTHRRSECYALSRRRDSSRIHCGPPARGRIHEVLGCIPRGAPRPLEAEDGSAHGSGDPTGGTARDADDLDVTQKQRHLEWRMSLTSNRFLRSFFHLLWKRKPVITPLVEGERMDSCKRHGARTRPCGTRYTVSIRSEYTSEDLTLRFLTSFHRSIKC